jgi:CHAT domain-containing protein
MSAAQGLQLRSRAVVGGAMVGRAVVGPAMLGRAMVALVLLAACVGCATPPPNAYVNRGAAAGKPAVQQELGKNAVGEPCTIQDTGETSADIYCGTWQQPSAKVRGGDAAGADALAGIATDSPWRAALDQRFTCQAPQSTTILDSRPAQLLQCTQRVGGWPHVAVVAQINGRAWFGDGVLPAATVMEMAIGVRAGLIKPGTEPPNSGADALLAQRLAAQSVSSGDIGQFNTLMSAGTRANLSDNPAAAEAAFRAALTLQQKALGKDNPNTATAVMTLALELSDDGRYAEATSLFDQAGHLAPGAADPIEQARLLHYRALDAVNRGQFTAADTLLRSAIAAYIALIPPSALARKSAPHAGGFGGSLVSDDQNMLTDPSAQGALVGLIEAQRNEALVLRQLGRLEESQAVLASATDLAEGNRLLRPIVAARLYLTGGVTAEAAGNSSLALSNLALSSNAFDRALPESKPLADTLLLRAGELARAGQLGEVLPLCRTAVASLAALKASTSADGIAPCLDAYAAAAAADASQRQALLAEMFTAAQLGQGGITSQQIAQATARLQENARDPHVAEAIRRREDASSKLQSLYTQRDAQTSANQGAGAAAAADTSAIDAQIKNTQVDLADADSALQAASPKLGQLEQDVAPASQVLATLHPHEALIEITAGPADGWVFVLTGGEITVGRMPIGVAAVDKLVRAVRAGIVLEDNLPTFDVADAHKLYEVTLGTVEPALKGVDRVVVAPPGPLLSLPFEVLLTAPADAAHLADAPWLVRRFTLAHVPAPANFVGLRKIASDSRATQPWFGFGDFVPVTLKQANGSFSGTSCADSAQLLAGLPQLPYARRELGSARTLLGSSAQDVLLGPAFTVPAVEKAPLKSFRVLHFAAHALLPSELKCQSEPAIVTSAPAGAPDATQALLTASDVAELNLDADLVILSACNSGGAGGTTAGESLSGLARAFFFAGARALMVTHWSVNDQVAAYLVVSVLQRMHADPSLGAAGALRATQLSMLQEAGKGLPAQIAAPFFWAGFAVIGDGGGSAVASVAQSTSPGGQTGL